MGVLYLFGRDGKVFAPPKFWDNVAWHSAGGHHGAQLSGLRLTALIFLILSVGAAGFWHLEGEVCTPGKKATFFSAAKPPVCRRAVTPLESFYFMFITLTTIGYGDVCPTNAYSRLWVCFMSLIGTSLMSTFLDVCGGWRVSLLSKLNQGMECVVCLALLLWGGLIVYANTEGLGMQDSLYLSLATSTTVGYGDVKPETSAGRVATLVYAALSLSVFGYVTSCVGDLIQPDSDTSIGFGGTENEWGLSLADRFFGRLEHKDADAARHQYSLSKNTKLQLVLALKIVLLVLASVGLVMRLQPDFSAVDALYFVIMTLTTVGYGDVVTSSSGSRLFEVSLALLGLGLFSCFTDVVGEWRSRLKFANDAVHCFLLLAIVLSFGTATFVAVEDLPWFDALYLSVATATTIGYGDLHPTTTKGKLAACAYACLSVSAMGYVCSYIGDLIQDLLCTHYEEEPPPGPAQKDKRA